MEADRISDALRELAAYLSEHDYGVVEVVVVTADSPDGTAKIAEAEGHLFEHFRLIHAGPRVGKGRDVRLGIFEATGRYRLFMDADLATPLHHLDEVKAFMDHDGQVAIAVRDLLTIHKSIPRKLMSKCANIAAQILVVPGIKDTQCGFKIFEAQAAQDIFSRQTLLEWSFDMEILAIARQLKLTIDFIPVDDWSDPKANSAGLAGDSILKIALGGFLDPFKIRLGIWSGRYKTSRYMHKSIY
jgi:dolichyl-phosphate beta-glucosyltransferase